MNPDIPPLVYVVILNWNSCIDTLECLGSLANTTYPNLKMLLVDNGSTDGTCDAVSASFPGVEQLRLSRNFGFAGGCNRGIDYALAHRGQHVLLLNNDTLVAPDMVGELVSAMLGDVGAVAPAIYYADSPNRMWSVWGKRHPVTLERIGSQRGQHDSGQWDAAIECDYLVGCALLLSRELLLDVGAFDERFFMYYEDMDLSLRSRKAGFKLILNPKARLWHKVSASSGGSDSANERYWMARSSVLFFAKHASPWQLMVIVPYRLGSMVKTLLGLTWRGRWDSMAAYLKGLSRGIVGAWSLRGSG